MSFSLDVKNEISRLISDDLDVQMMELSAMLRTSGALKIVGLNKLAFDITTENPAVARKIFIIIKNCFDINVEIQVNQNGRIKKNKIYYLSVSNEQGANLILKELGIINIEDDKIYFLDNIPSEMISKKENKRAYIRGAFLGSGSVTDPNKKYHMEFAITDIDFGKKLIKLLSSCGVSSKMIERKGTNVVYIKDSEKISDVLNIIGAHKALLELENIKAKKQILNDVNRQVNCEKANIDKIINTAARQIESIDYIVERKGIKYLPENLQKIAKLRKKYYDLDLLALGQKMKPPLGKSGVNYRLKKIDEIAEKLRESAERG